MAPGLKHLYSNRENRHLDSYLEYVMFKDGGPCGRKREGKVIWEGFLEELTPELRF